VPLSAGDHDGIVSIGSVLRDFRLVNEDVWCPICENASVPYGRPFSTPICENSGF
jgi:hypothetical protein